MARPLRFNNKQLKPTRSIVQNNSDSNKAFYAPKSSDICLFSKLKSKLLLSRAKVTRGFTDTDLRRGQGSSARKPRLDTLPNDVSLNVNFIYEILEPKLDYVYAAQGLSSTIFSICEQLSFKLGGVLDSGQSD